MVAALAALPLRNEDVPLAVWPLEEDPLQEWLWAEHQIEVPVFAWSALGKRMLRISAAAHNMPEDYETLIAALGEAPPGLL